MTLSVASSGGRHLVAALSLSVVFSFAPVPVSAAPAAHALRPIVQVATPLTVVRHPKHRKPKICPVKWRRGPQYVQRLIRCAAIHWRVPGGPQMALFIAWRESHYQPSAYNPSGAEGIYQHMRQYWPTRAATYGFPHWSPFNARANVIVTMRMVHAMGSWAPWGE
jgi:Transglycosylase SLT domain